MKTREKIVPAVLLLLMTACSGSIESRIADVLLSACPPSSLSDPKERDRCADRLTEAPDLRDAIKAPVWWGAQAADSSLADALDDSSVTEFNPRVWRRMYLSTFTFQGEPRVEEAGEYRILKMRVRFRNSMPAAEYPYPFWHSQKKWQSYEQSPEILFYFRGDELVGALRSKELDPSRSHIERIWDGNWTVGGEEPRVTLFSYLFSPANPYVPSLDDKYRALSEDLRAESCLVCHSPDNSSGMKHLELLNYPAQSLAGRHDLVRMLEANLMPPGIGIADETARRKLIGLARTFAEAGDLALAFEGEPINR